MTMGKKAKLKAIRRIAAELPEIHVKRASTPEIVYGSELIKKGVTELSDGTKINYTDKYKKGTVVDAPVNHHRQMKKLYNQHGAAGVRMYVAAAERHAAKMEQQKKKVVEEKPIGVSIEKSFAERELLASSIKKPAFDPAVGEGEE